MDLDQWAQSITDLWGRDLIGYIEKLRMEGCTCMGKGALGTGGLCLKQRRRTIQKNCPSLACPWRDYLLTVLKDLREFAIFKWRFWVLGQMRVWPGQSWSNVQCCGSCRIRNFLARSYSNQCSGSGSTCFWGSGSTSQRYGSGFGSGSGSFYHHAKIVRKTLIPSNLWLFLTFYLWKMM
jgi:hypothetical protein